MNVRDWLNISSRDRLLALVLPAILIFIYYSLVLAKKPNVRLKLLSVQLTGTQAVRPSGETIAQHAAAKLISQTNLNNARQENQTLRQSLNRHVDNWQDRSRRLRANDDLTVLWRRHNLTLMEQSCVGTNDLKSSQLLVRLQQQTRFLLQREFEALLWEVRLEGAFPAMCQALEEISASDLPIIPLIVEMQRKPNSDHKLWTLRLWQ